MINGEEVLNYIFLHFSLNCFTSYVNVTYYILINLFYREFQWFRNTCFKPWLIHIYGKPRHVENETII